MEFIHRVNGMKLYFSSNDFTDNFDNDFKEFREAFKDADIQDYIKENITFYSACMDNVTYLKFDDGNAFIKADYLGVNIVPEIGSLIKTPENEIDQFKRKQLSYTFASILKFLKSKLIDRSTENHIDPLPLLDYGHAKNTEKIIILHQLGIIDFLRKKKSFKTSTHSMSNVIAAFTGLNTRTANSYIHPIVNPSADQKSNPLLTEKSVSEVRIKLSAMGYNPAD